MTVAELLNGISSRELSEWIAFYSLEPFGFEADYLGHAQTCSTVVNVNRKKGSKASTAKDFFPKLDEDKDVSINGAMNYAAALTTAHGGEVKRHGLS